LSDQEPSRINIPNALALLRLVGSPALLVLAYADLPIVFLIVFLFLTFTDWIDGKLAIWLKQQTTFGAQLDSVADHTMYACLVAGGLYLRSEVFWNERFWIAAALVSYVCSMAAGWCKFGRFPSYHNQAAKIAWFLVMLATVSLFLDWSPWFLRAAAAMVTLSNLESIAITVALDHWQEDVRSIFLVGKHRADSGSTTDRE